MVTRFGLTTHGVVDVLFGQAVFLLHDLPRAVGHYADAMADAPDGLSAICIIRLAPPMPGMPTDLIGEPIVMFNAVWSGDLADGGRNMRRLLTAGGPVASEVYRMPYIAVQSMQDDLHPHGRYNYNKSRYLGRVDDTALKALLDSGLSLPGEHSQIEVLRLGGAAGRVPADATAFAHRDAAYILNVVAAWTEPSEGDAHVLWAREAYSRIEDCVSSGRRLHQLPRHRTRPGRRRVFRRDLLTAPGHQAARRPRHGLPRQRPHRASVLIHLAASDPPRAPRSGPSHLSPPGSGMTDISSPPAGRTLLVTSIACCLSVCVAQTALAIPATLNGLLQAALHTSGSQLTWISSATLLPVAVLGLTFGVLGDLFGRKRLLIGGAMVLAAGEVVSAAAGSMGYLIAGQALAYRRSRHAPEFPRHDRGRCSDSTPARRGRSPPGRHSWRAAASSPPCSVALPAPTPPGAGRSSCSALLGAVSALVSLASRNSSAPAGPSTRPARGR